MNSSPIKPLLLAYQGKAPDRVPFWFMRQAGRYLPEYREIRKDVSQFLDMCYNPALASEVTIQPVTRFGMDGAIIFSDILVVPHAMGVGVRFEEKKGPILTPIQSPDALKALHCNPDKLAPVYEALRLTRAALAPEKTLIGFAGAPWTLACYTVQGKSDQAFERVKLIASTNPSFFSDLIEQLSHCVLEHCLRQIQAGADVIQLFDSWAGVLNEKEFRQWVIEPTAWIVKGIKKVHPHVPVIGFPRQARSLYLMYAEQTGVDGVNIDSSVPLAWAKEQLQDVCLVQGNLDPILLADDKDAMLAQAKEIISMLANKAFVFNLGHGILPHTPVEHVQALCDFLRNYERL